MQISRFEQERAEVVKSAMLCKAVLTNPKGGVYIVVAFEKSTRHEFWFVFSAKTARTPRKAWKPAGYFAREGGGYHDLGSFVAYFASLRQARVQSTKVLRAKALTNMKTARIRESLHAAQVMQDVTKISTKLVEQKYQRGRMGRNGIFQNWSKA